MIALLLAGCLAEPAPEVADLQPPPALMSLSVPVFEAGGVGEATVTGATPGALVWFAWSGGFGQTCPAGMGGACTDLATPIQVLGRAVAGPNGQARLVFRAPTTTSNVRLAVQAMTQGAPAEVSNAVAVWIAPAGSGSLSSSDLDGDGFKPSTGDCDDGDAMSYPGAADPLGDRRDTSCDGIDGVDADRDRVASAASGGTDCDDARAATRPDAPETCDWIDDDCDGEVDEGLPDVDADGVADCKQVAVIITRGALDQAANWTCDGQPFIDREVQELTALLGELGLSMTRIDEDPLVGVPPASVAHMGAILVDNVGWGPALRGATPDALLSGPPLLIVGDDAGLMINASGRLDLMAHVGLASVEHNGNLAFKGLGTELSSSASPVLDGPWGAVDGFSYTGDIDHVTLANTGEDVLLTKVQIGSPAAWIAEDRDVAVLMVGAFSTNTCPLYDDPGRAAAAALIENTLWRLMGF